MTFWWAVLVLSIAAMYGFDLFPYETTMIGIVLIIGTMILDEVERIREAVE